MAIVAGRYVQRGIAGRGHRFADFGFGAVADGAGGQLVVALCLGRFTGIPIIDAGGLSAVDSAAI